MTVLSNKNHTKLISFWNMRVKLNKASTAIDLNWKFRWYKPDNAHFHKFCGRHTHYWALWPKQTAAVRTAAWPQQHILTMVTLPKPRRFEPQQSVKAIRGGKPVYALNKNFFNLQCQMYHDIWLLYLIGLTISLFLTYVLTRPWLGGDQYTFFVRNRLIGQSSILFRLDLVLDLVVYC